MSPGVVMTVIIRYENLAHDTLEWGFFTPILIFCQKIGGGMGL